jgi:hypothetical protein
MTYLSLNLARNSIGDANEWRRYELSDSRFRDLIRKHQVTPDGTSLVLKIGFLDQDKGMIRQRDIMPGSLQIGWSGFFLMPDRQGASWTLSPYFYRQAAAHSPAPSYVDHVNFDLEFDFAMNELAKIREIQASFVRGR